MLGYGLKSMERTIQLIKPLRGHIGQSSDKKGIIVIVTTIEVDEAPEGEEDADEETVEAKKPVIGPVTIWIGVFPESTSATAAHDAAQDVLLLLKDYQITDVDVDFRESFYTRLAGLQLLEPVGDLDPLVNIGGGNDNLLDLSCRHVLIGPKEANINYVRHPSRPPKDVPLLGKRAFTNLVDSIKPRIGRHGIAAKRRRKQIEGFEEREKGTNAVDVEKAKVARMEIQGLVDKAEKAMEALAALIDQVNKDWKKLDNCVLAHILRSPAISLGVGEQRFTEDWGVFQIHRAKLGDGFQGSKLDLAANWVFEYPEDRRLPLRGTITDGLMCTPDMWDLDGEPCLLVIKSGNTTNTTIGRANGVFSIVRDYFQDMSISQTSMDKSGVFSEPGDSGSVIADIRGRIGVVLTGGSGKTKSSDITYATPFWWLLERIKANGFPNAHLGIVT
ncbi:hypothetical protein H4582DRAFT_2119419 [Lactarius indigo]|nr:hypothetical protein H4582DRAFT_2119419 [Lactarius indigo]